MKFTLHHCGGMVAAVAILLSVLSGCAQVGIQHEAGAAASAAAEKLPPPAEAVALLYYAQTVRVMNGKELADELERLRQAQAAEKSDFVTLQYALALSVPGASVANQRRALPPPVA